MKNLKEFKALIETYKSLSLDEINELWEEAENELSYKQYIAEHVAQSLTGFGYQFTCSLCKAVSNDCSECVWRQIEEGGMSCIHGESLKSYDRVRYSESSEQLLEAYQARAEYMEHCLSSLKVE